MNGGIHGNANTAVLVLISDCYCGRRVLFEVDAVIVVDRRNLNRNLGEDSASLEIPRACRSTSRVGRRWAKVLISIPPLSTSWPA